jgi:hypothetical protein
VLYRYTPDRKGQHCRVHLSTFRGHLHADGYAGFAELYERFDGAPAGVHEVSCWAHVRRKFFDVYKANVSPLAQIALERIGDLFDIEAQSWARRLSSAAQSDRRWQSRGLRPCATGST